MTRLARAELSGATITPSKPTDPRPVLATSAVLDVPADVQLCPYCGGRLHVQFAAWTQADNGAWEAESVELDCDTMPDFDSGKWEEWHARHSDMPYVYWLPATQAVEKWVNKNYRFEVD